MASLTRSARLGTAPAGSRRTIPRTIVRAVAPETSAPATQPHAGSFFMVNNVFKVKPEHFENFEATWRERESHLKEMPGFIRFAMLKCTNVPGKYISQTCWQDKASFENWTQSQQFKASHGGGKDSSGNTAPSKRPPVMVMLEGPPSPELFETVTVTEA